MQFKDVCEKIKSGEIILDQNGHEPHGTILDYYEETVADANGARDGKWNYSGDEDRAAADAKMREWNQEELDRKIVEGQINYRPETRCWRCGQRLYYVLLGNTFKACTVIHHDDWKIRPTLVQDKCAYSEKKPLTGTLKVTGKLLFANFFLHVEDTPNGDRYGEEWSLNYHAGRANITKYKAENNVAYGQMGNMSVGIFLHPNKKSIIIGDPYIAERNFEKLCDELGDEKANELYDDPAEYKKLETIEGHEFVEKISCEVWRWEAADRNDLNQEQYDALAERQSYSGLVEVEVEQGNWQFEHYYRTECPQDNETIYARLTLTE